MGEAVRTLTREERGVVRVAARKAGRVIAQAELQAIADGELRIRGLRKELEALQQEVEGARLGVLHALKKGLVAERGPLAALLKVVKGRRTPAWKEEYARALGAEAVDQVIAGTEPTPDRETIEVVRVSE